MGEISQFSTLLNKMAKITQIRLLLLYVFGCISDTAQCRYEEGSTPSYAVMSKGPFNQSPGGGSYTIHVSIRDENLSHKEILQSNLRCTGSGILEVSLSNLCFPGPVGKFYTH